MKYILLCQPRSGSTYLYSYMNEYNSKHNQMFGLSEYFNFIRMPISLPDRLMSVPVPYIVANNTHLDMNINEIREIIRNDNFNRVQFIKNKYELLVSERNNNNNEYSIKLTTLQFYDNQEYMKNRILPFYTDYTFILLTRNLFDVFISREVQLHTKWAQIHGKCVNDTTLNTILTPFNVSEKNILNFLDQQDWVHDVYTTIKNKYNYIEIDYAILNEEYLENLFELTIHNHTTFPLNTDYKKYIMNYDDVKKSFYGLL